MCMIDYGDGYAITLSAVTYTAKKQHRCNECHRTIEPGEKYLRETNVFEHRRNTYKTCSHCKVARDWLWNECGGFIWGSVEEDIREHVFENYYAMDLARVAMGMQWKWRTPSGKLLPIPKMPMGSVEIRQKKQEAQNAAHL
jgi:hypothetical protein